MNQEECFAELDLLLNSFRCHTRLLGELLELIAKTGAERNFLSTLLTRLRNLRSMGVQVTQQRGFELLGDGIFSMRIAGKNYNIRILFAFLPDKTPYLLHAFYERAGKRVSDYSGKISLAKSRLAESEEESN